MTRPWVALTSWLLLLPWLSHAEPWNPYLEGSHGPYRGRVIDAESKQPLEGAAVVAVWSREIAQLVQTNTVFFATREALTGMDGTFRIEAKDLEERAPYKTLRPRFV